MPWKTYQLFLKGLKNQTTIISIDEDATIARLREKASEISGVPDDDMRLLFQSKELRSIDEHGEVQTLKDYRIGDQSNLFLVLRLVQTMEDYIIGDQLNPCFELRLMVGSEKSISTQQPKIYDSDVQLTFQPDMITLDDEEGGQRAEMPCGHAIGPESLTAFCRSLLTADRFEFRCPYKDSTSDLFCDTLWEFFTVKRLAVLTEEEKNEFEIKITENYLRKAVGIQECPRCKSYCERKNKKDIRVICPICTKEQNSLYEFCWCCLKTWLGSGTKDCGNLDCTGQDPRLGIVKNCPTKQVVGVNCPAIRACPTCGMLIEHEDACKHMVCPCKEKFCFICLKKADASGSYVCGSYNSKCEVGPVQTSIPGDQ